MLKFTTAALGGLLNLSILKYNYRLTFTVGAAEQGAFHFGIYFGATNHNASYTDQSVDVFRSQIPHD